MNYEIFKKKNYLNLYNKILKNKWIISCFCVNWCENCRKFQKNFFNLSKKNNNFFYLWIDIEENYNFFNNIIINKFPKILIQYKKNVIFFSNIEINFIKILNFIKKLNLKTKIELKEFIKNNNTLYNWKQYNLLNYFKKKLKNNFIYINK